MWCTCVSICQHRLTIIHTWTSASERSQSSINTQYYHCSIYRGLTSSHTHNTHKTHTHIGQTIARDWVQPELDHEFIDCHSQQYEFISPIVLYIHIDVQVNACCMFVCTYIWTRACVYGYMREYKYDIFLWFNMQGYARVYECSFVCRLLGSWDVPQSHIVFYIPIVGHPSKKSSDHVAMDNATHFAAVNQYVALSNQPHYAVWHGPIRNALVNCNGNEMRFSCLSYTKWDIQQGIHTFR